MFHRTSVVLQLGVIVVALGCAAKPLPTPPVPPATLVTTCGTWLCQTNSASLGNGLYFHELDANGKLPNDQGIMYLGFQDNHQMPLTLAIQGHAITATDAAGGFYQGTRLIGAIFTLEIAGGAHVQVLIKEVGQIPFWVHSELEQVPTYWFQYRRLTGPLADNEFHDLCTKNELSTEWEARSGTVQTLALVFAGDRYNPHTKQVTMGPALEQQQAQDESHWFNVACAGSAMAKMHLLRHTTAGIAGTPAGPLTTTGDERQAMLKMITDDICGTGYSFTVDGEDVSYMDAKQWHPFALAKSGTIEAIWSKDGALCLDEPRREKEDKTIPDAISKQCTRPVSCQVLLKDNGYQLSDWDQLKGAYGISANPP